MLLNYLIPETGNAYKANFHCHSTNSDGAFSPEEIRRLYRENGYSIVAFTDHWTYVDNSALSEPGFLALSGYELNFDLREGPNRRLLRTCHLCAIARDPKHCAPIPGEGEYDIAGINRAIEALNAGGFIVNLNHTSWSAMPEEDIRSIRGIVGMELFNSTCDFAFQGRAELYHYMQAIIGGRHLLPIAADDNHYGTFGRGKPRAAEDCCRAFLMIKADRLEYEAVLDAYLAGHYYCSNGPRIHSAYIEGDWLVVDCSPVRRAYLKTKYVTFNDAVVRRHDTLTHVEFDLTQFRKDCPFVMVLLEDESGRFACTVPYYFH